MTYLKKSALAAPHGEENETRFGAPSAVAYARRINGDGGLTQARQRSARGGTLWVEARHRW